MFPNFLHKFKRFLRFKAHKKSEEKVLDLMCVHENNSDDFSS